MQFPQDEEKRLSLRTARDYMKLARNWSRLCDEHPAGFSSQRHAMKALAPIVQADKSDADGASSAARCRTGEGALDSGATALTPSLSQTERHKKRRRNGPVWRASGPFVSEALRLVSSVDATLERLVDEGFPLAPEAHKVHAALERLRDMAEREIDEAEDAGRARVPSNGDRR